MNLESLTRIMKAVNFGLLILVLVLLVLALSRCATVPRDTGTNTELVHVDQVDIYDSGSQFPSILGGHRRVRFSCKHGTFTIDEDRFGLRAPRAGEEIMTTFETNSFGTLHHFEFFED